MNKQIESQQHILLVEDDEKLSTLISKYLQKNDFHVDTELRGDTAVQKILDLNPDLVLLDVMLPGLDGFEVCKQVRSIYKGSILMLTAKDDDIDQIVGLEIGADDYVIKPVEPRLLLARIRAQLRQTAVHDVASLDSDAFSVSKNTTLDFDSLIINRSTRTVMRDQKKIVLTSVEFDLLWFLASHAGKTLSREVICQQVFNVEYNGLNRSVDNKISRLRQCLQDNSSTPEGIKTIRNKGYLFVASGW